MAGKKILTQFALPVGSTSGDFGNGTAGQVLTTGGDSASMYWDSAGGVTKVVKSLQVSTTDGTDHYEVEHNLGTTSFIVQVETHPTSSTGYTLAQRLSQKRGIHLDVGHDVIVVPCEANGNISSTKLMLDFSSFDYSNGQYFYVTIIG